MLASTSTVGEASNTTPVPRHSKICVVYSAHGKRNNRKKYCYYWYVRTYGVLDYYYYLVMQRTYATRCRAILPGTVYGTGTVCVPKMRIHFGTTNEIYFAENSELTVCVGGFEKYISRSRIIGIGIYHSVKLPRIRRHN